MDLIIIYFIFSVEILEKIENKKNG